MGQEPGDAVCYSKLRIQEGSLAFPTSDLLLGSGNRHFLWRSLSGSYSLISLALYGWKDKMSPDPLSTLKFTGSDLVQVCRVHTLLKSAGAHTPL